MWQSVYDKTLYSFVGEGCADVSRDDKYFIDKVKTNDTYPTKDDVKTSLEWMAWFIVNEMYP